MSEAENIDQIVVTMRLEVTDLQKAKLFGYIMALTSREVHVTAENQNEKLEFELPPSIEGDPAIISVSGLRKFYKHEFEDANTSPLDTVTIRKLGQILPHATRMYDAKGNVVGLDRHSVETMVQNVKSAKTKRPLGPKGWRLLTEYLRQLPPQIPDVQQEQ